MKQKIFIWKKAKKVSELLVRKQIYEPIDIAIDESIID